jgi:FKBP-type peptidyl-prolyl cis-trans isomerase SlyD
MIRIAPGAQVTFFYKMKSTSGEFWDESGDKPLVYIHGSGQMIPGFEAELEGLSAGEKKTFLVTPDQAYGVVDPDRVWSVPRAMLGDETVDVGDEVVLESDQGDQVHGVVRAMEESEVVIDGNHPLAGQTLQFEVEVVQVESKN